MATLSRVGAPAPVAGVAAMLYSPRVMRTTLDIDDDVLSAAEQLAAAQKSRPARSCPISPAGRWPLAPATSLSGIATACRCFRAMER
jgi:hypothetical protein